MRNESTCATSGAANTPDGLSTDERFNDDVSWKTLSPRSAIAPVSSEGGHAAEIRRILQRQEIARKGFVCICLAACVLILIAIWFELTW